MTLQQQKQPFDHDEWVFEFKYDGLRGLCYVKGDTGALVNRSEFGLTRFDRLATQVAKEVDAVDAILDGEVVCLGDDGRARFYDLMFNRAEPIFAAFDILWLDGEDLSDLPLWERKSILEGVLVQPPESVLYIQHVEADGTQLYDPICELDMEGIVCKPSISPYRKIEDQPPWIKVKNPEYSQAEGRRELFNKRR